MDTSALLVGLEDYHDSLNKHLAELRAEYEQLENSWHRFNHVYGGDAAEQFRANWARTAENFQTYIERTTKIRKMLEDRIEELRSANRVEEILG